MRSRNQRPHGSISEAIKITKSRIFLTHFEKKTYDKYLLPCESGVIDLRTGKTRKGRRDEYLTEPLGYDPEPGEHPVFNQFLNHISREDPEVLNWILNWLGLCLTGIENSRIVLFVIGEPGSGKTTFAEFVISLLEGYATAINPENLDARNFRAHASWKAALRGKRFATMSEIKQELALNTATLNDLSGGGTIKANFMRQDEIEFIAQAKFLIVGNHRPRLPSSRDDGIYDRLRYLELSIKPQDKDPHILDKLKDERPAILHTIVQYAKRLIANNEELPQTPTAMTVAADDFAAEQDHFYHDVIDIINRHQELASHGLMWVSDLYRYYQDAYPTSHFQKSKTYFTRKLSESFKGLVSKRKTRREEGKYWKDHTLDIRTVIVDEDKVHDANDEPPF